MAPAIRVLPAAISAVGRGSRSSASHRRPVAALDAEGALDDHAATAARPQRLLDGGASVTGGERRAADDHGEVAVAEREQVLDGLGHAGAVVEAGREGVDPVGLVAVEQDHRQLARP